MFTLQGASLSALLDYFRLNPTFLDAHLRNFLLDKGGEFPSGGIQNNPRGHRGSEPVFPPHPTCQTAGIAAPNAPKAFVFQAGEPLVAEIEIPVTV